MRDSCQTSGGGPSEGTVGARVRPPPRGPVTTNSRVSGVTHRGRWVSTTRGVDSGPGGVRDGSVSRVISVPEVARLVLPSSTHTRRDFLRGGPRDLSTVENPLVLVLPEIIPTTGRW